MALSYDKFGFSESLYIISDFFIENALHLWTYQSSLGGGGRGEGGKGKQATSKRLNIPSVINVWDRRKCHIFTMIHRGFHSNSFLKSPLVSLKCFFFVRPNMFLDEKYFYKGPIILSILLIFSNSMYFTPTR